EDGLLRVGDHAVEAAEDGERQDHILVLAALEGVADEVRDAPEEADDLAVIHGHTLRSAADGVPYRQRLPSRRRSPPPVCRATSPSCLASKARVAVELLLLFFFGLAIQCFFSCSAG